jgi:dihydrofolate reductase
VIYGIIAHDDRGGAGKDGTLPWPRHHEDMRRFSKLTKGNIVLMGAATWDSDMPTPLPGRLNVVASRCTEKYEKADMVVEDAALFLDDAKEDVWVIGGPSLFSSVIDRIEKVYVTHILGSWQCDVFYDLAGINHAFKFKKEKTSPSAIFKIGEKI